MDSKTLMRARAQGKRRRETRSWKSCGRWAQRASSERQAPFYAAAAQHLSLITRSRLVF